MEGRAFPRTSSMPDLASGTPTSVLPMRTGSVSNAIDTLSTTAYGSDRLSTASTAGFYGSSEEDGLALLIHGSPISDNLSDGENTEAGGLQLLDYESESDIRKENVMQQEYKIQMQNQVEMDTEPLPGTSGSGVQGEKTKPVMDSVYFQCRSARTSM